MPLITSPLPYKFSPLDLIEYKDWIHILSITTYLCTSDKMPKVKIRKVHSQFTENYWSQVSLFLDSDKYESVRNCMLKPTLDHAGKI